MKNSHGVGLSSSYNDNKCDGAVFLSVQFGRGHDPSRCVIYHEEFTLKQQNKKKFSNKLTVLPRTAADNETITKLWYFCSKRNSEANLNSIYLLGFQATVQCTSQNIFLINSPPTSKLVTSLRLIPLLSGYLPFRQHTFPPSHLPQTTYLTIYKSLFISSSV